MLPPHPNVLKVVASHRLDSAVRSAEATSGRGARERLGSWLVAAGLRLAPELASSRSGAAR